MFLSGWFDAQKATVVTIRQLPPGHHGFVPLKPVKAPAAGYFSAVKHHAPEAKLHRGACKQIAFPFGKTVSGINLKSSVYASESSRYRMSGEIGHVCLVFLIIYKERKEWIFSDNRCNTGKS